MQMIRARKWHIAAVAVAAVALTVGGVLASQRGGTSPTPGLPPVAGATNPDVTQATIGRTICIPGWTATVRPPSSYTNALKAQQMADWQLPGKPSDYEEDHLIPLALGGAGDDPANLWPQAYAGANGARTKDKLETRLHRLVCAGSVTLAVAQSCIMTDWIACARRYP